MKRRAFLGALFGAIASVAVFKAETVAKLFAVQPERDYYAIQWPMSDRRGIFGGYDYQLEALAKAIAHAEGMK